MQAEYIQAMRYNAIKSAPAECALMRAVDRSSLERPQPCMSVRVRTRAIGQSRASSAHVRKGFLLADAVRWPIRNAGSNREVSAQI